MNKMTCRGPRVYVKQARAALDARIAELRDKREAAPDEGRAPFERKLAELEAEHQALSGRADDDYIGRAGCGHDLTVQIAGIPDDGDVYHYVCPRCGNTGTVHKVAPEASAA